MTVQRLTTEQHASVDLLVEARAIETVPADNSRASAFMRKARVKLDDIDNVTHAENRFDLAYGACHDVGEALLAVYGYRTSQGAGQHKALGRYLTAVIDGPPGVEAARSFERLRRKRNAQDYRAAPITDADAAGAVRSARELISAAEKRGVA